MSKQSKEDPVIFVISAFYTKECPLYLCNLIQAILRRGHFVCLINTGQGEIPDLEASGFLGVKRKNLGYDFASYLVLREFLQEKFSENFIVFLNDSVYYLEPERLILKIERLQKSKDKDILYFMNDSYERKHHYQSFFMAGRFRDAFSQLLQNIEKDFLPLPPKFKEEMIAVEFRITSEAEKLGIQVEPFFDYLEIRSKSAFEAEGFFSNPTHRCAEFFLSCSIPFIKKDLILKEIRPGFLKSDLFRKKILTNATRRKILADMLRKC